jgi:C4-dicarboxylate-specific signal transduction histidine kinase
MLLLRHLAQTASLRLRMLGTISGEAGPGRELGDLLRRASLGDLLAAVMHDANNPLAAISSRLELLAQEREEDPVVVAHLRVLIPGMERVTEIMKRARTATRCGREPSGPVDICAEIRLLADALVHHYSTRNVGLELDLPPECPPAEGRADRLQQVWLNLLGNAFEATRRREDARGIIRIKVRPYLKLGRITVEVKDNGPGMEGQIVAWLNAPDRSAEPPAGVGLGIREVLRVLAEQEGNIRVTSSHVRGTAVRISLKVSKSLSEAR